MLHSWVA